MRRLTATKGEAYAEIGPKGPVSGRSGPEWKYVKLPRYFIYVEHSIDRGTRLAVFEPNGEPLSVGGSAQGAGAGDLRLPLSPASAT